MGIELATTGRMSTRRPEGQAVMLRGIKAGEWSYRRTESLALELFEHFRAAEEQSALREHPDHEAANELLLQVIRITHPERRAWPEPAGHHMGL